MPAVVNCVGKQKPYKSLEDRTGEPQLYFWKYRQLHHFFAVHGSSIRDITLLTPFEGLFVAEEPIPHMISELYLLLGSSASASKPICIRAWERDLGKEFFGP